ncbi:hypothetical protein H4Q26_004885 [Puccinia striiformis f. sp. tritici PST-130]|nr:hypothetical protein H4Q26_004885 [Puccinia striiformis f. sp. tritici PST-130]
MSGWDVEKPPLTTTIPVLHHLTPPHEKLLSRVFGMFSQHQMLKTILAAACLSLSTWAQSSPPAGATISSAVAALAGLTGPKTIFVYPGSYAEQVKISYSYPLNLRGFSNNPTSAGSNRVTVRAAISAAQAGSNAKSATIWAHSAENAINSFGTETDTQALSLASTGQRQAFSFCSFSSFQDTVKVDGSACFIGSRIEGAVDFVFGSGSAWFESVIMAVKASPYAKTITAQRNSPGGKTAFVFSRSQVISAGATRGSTYLGRPWSEYASVVFQSCSLSDIINPAGWSVWAPNNPQTAHVRFQEYQNNGPGASTSARQLELKELLLCSSKVSWDLARFKTAEGARARLATYVGLSSKRTPEEYRIPVNAAHLQRHVPFLKNSAAKPKKHGELLSLYNDRGADASEVRGMGLKPLNLQGFSTNPTSTASNQVTVRVAISAAQAAAILKHPNLKPVSSAVFQPELYALHHIAKNVINSFGTGKDTQALALASAVQRQGKQCDALTHVESQLSAHLVLVVLAVKASPHATVITAQRNSPGGQTAFVFSRSQVISAGATRGSTYLGRPWSEYASVVFQSCSLSDIINPAGWSVWAPNNPQTAHVRFQEHQNMGPGASTSARQFGTQRTSPVLIESIWESGHSSWAR